MCLSGCVWCLLCCVAGFLLFLVLCSLVIWLCWFFNIVHSDAFNVELSGCLYIVQFIFMLCSVFFVPWMW